MSSNARNATIFGSHAMAAPLQPRCSCDRVASGLGLPGTLAAWDSAAVSTPAVMQSRFRLPDPLPERRSSLFGSLEPPWDPRCALFWWSVQLNRNRVSRAVRSFAYTRRRRLAFRRRFPERLGSFRVGFVGQAIGQRCRLRKRFLGGLRKPLGGGLRKRLGGGL